MFGSYRAYSDNVTPLQYIMGKLWSGVRNREDGGTYRVDMGSTPTEGYVVGGVTQELVMSPDTDPRDRYASLLQWVTHVVDHHPNALVGFWRDTETGLYHFDVNRYTRDAGKALAMGREAGEIAIWDIRNSVEIRL